MKETLKEKVKYEKPKLARLDNSLELTKGNCENGSGDVGNCSQGISAAGWCVIGQFAGACLTGNGI
jgi:hypothetical protein